MDFLTTGRRGTGYAVLIGVILCFPVMPVRAANWEDIQRAAEKIKSVSANFSQEKHLQILTKPLVSKGRFYFLAPDSVRWEYTSPVKSILLMRKENIKRYTAGSKGIVEDSGGAVQSMHIVLQEISRWSKGQFNKSEFFSATLREGKEQQVILIPKEKGLSAMISRIVITLLPERPGVLKSVKVDEDVENYTIFNFTDVQINGNISERLFREVE